MTSGWRSWAVDVYGDLINSGGPARLNGATEWADCPHCVDVPGRACGVHFFSGSDAAALTYAHMMKHRCGVVLGYVSAIGRVRPDADRQYASIGSKRAAGVRIHRMLAPLEWHRYVRNPPVPLKPLESGSLGIPHGLSVQLRGPIAPEVECFEAASRPDGCRRQ